MCVVCVWCVRAPVRGASTSSSSSSSSSESLGSHCTRGGAVGGVSSSVSVRVVCVCACACVCVCVCVWYSIPKALLLVSASTSSSSSSSESLASHCTRGGAVGGARSSVSVRVVCVRVCVCGTAYPRHFCWSVLPPPPSPLPPSRWLACAHAVARLAERDPLYIYVCVCV